MAGEWLETTLGKVADFLSGSTPSKARAEYWTGSIPWASAKDLKRFRLEDTQDHVSEAAVENGLRLVPPGTSLMLTRGMTLLNDVPIGVAQQRLAFNQDIKALRPSNSVGAEYFPYLLLGNKHRIHSLVDLAGHGTGRLNTDELKALEIRLPPLPEQRAIAHILGTLDDKIELNRRMTETLEETSRALFKSWFVDFDPVWAKAEGRDPGLPKPLADLFPDRLVDSELGEIPEGWEVRTFGDVAAQLREGVNPQDSPGTLFHHFSIPAYDDEKWPKSEAGESIKSVKSRVPAGAVLLSKLNPEIERVWLVDVQADDRSICSTEFIVLVPREPLGRSYVYCLARSSLFRQELEGLVTGTSKSRQRAQVGAVLALQIVRPPDALLRRFENVAESLLARSLVCRREAHVLATLRDVLLPDLISGDLRLGDPGRMLGNGD